MSTTISFLTDFGLLDSSVGQCKGVIAAIAPKAVVIDISHSVPHFNVRIGAWMLRHAVPYFPPSVHVAVVDPGVGTARRELAIECGRGDILIGPDNGILVDAAASLGGIVGVTLLEDSKFRHHPVSNTFHARDIFCPAAAHIVHGVSVHLLGPQIDPSSVVTLNWPAPVVVGGAVHTQVAYVNEFGSLALYASAPIPESLRTAKSVTATVGEQSLTAEIVTTFGDAPAGAVVLLVDSYGQLCLAQNQGNLAATMGIKPTDTPLVVIEASATTVTQA